MRPTGFSTGAIAFGDFRAALIKLQGCNATAIELSALREHELTNLLDQAPDLPLDQFSYKSLHAPSKLIELSEQHVADRLREFAL